MKAISLWQPWATLVAFGAKSIETRHWPAPHWALGERVAIHAAKGGLSKRDLVAVCGTPPFTETLRRALRMGPDASVETVVRELPRGCVVATALLARCARITETGSIWLEHNRPHEHAFGNYSLAEGQRYAWVLRDVIALRDPAPATGRQGFFDWDPDPMLFGEPA